MNLKVLWHKSPIENNGVNRRRKLLRKDSKWRTMPAGGTSRFGKITLSEAKKGVLRWRGPASQWWVRWRRRWWGWWRWGESEAKKIFLSFTIDTGKKQLINKLSGHLNPLWFRAFFWRGESETRTSSTSWFTGERAQRTSGTFAKPFWIASPELGFSSDGEPLLMG